MSADLVSVFANLELRFPAADMNAVRDFTRTFRSDGAEQAEIDRRPFRRYVDLWWAALCIGFSMRRRATDIAEWHKFIETNQILNSDPWRAEHLLLLAIAEEDSTEVVGHPGRIIQMANEYAAAGLRVLLETMLRETRPIWAATKIVEEMATTLEASPGD